MATAVHSRVRSGNGIRSNGKFPKGQTTTRSTSLAQGLGWFSIGLGLAQVAAPREVARFIGVEDSDRNTSLMRAIGMRELAAGMGILSQRNEGAWLWGRVLGDTMDLALLAAAMNNRSNDRTRTAAAAAAVLGVALLDAVVAKQRAADHHRDEADEFVTDAPQLTWRENGTTHIRKSITINRSVEEVSERFADATQRPGLMRHLSDAEVQVCAGPRGTAEVRVEVTTDKSRIAELARKLRHDDTAAQLERDLRHLRQVIEIGEVVHSDASVYRGMHPAKPSTEVTLP